MFSERSLPRDLERLRSSVAPEARVLDVDRDFETLPPAVAEDLGLLVDSLDPATYPESWLPADAPEVLRTYAGPTFTIGMPGDGTVAWTRQTDPPVVLVKQRAEGTPDDFLDFLIATALVEISTDAPEHCLPFFGERYRDLDAAMDLDPVGVYQVAAALYDAWLGLQSREVFAGWADEGAGVGDEKAGVGDERAGVGDERAGVGDEKAGVGDEKAGVGDEERPDAGDDDFARLHAAWVDAGGRLEGRLAGLSGEVARGETSFPAATEYACSAVKHGLDLPTPFSALDTMAYRDHGASYAVRWAEKTFAALRE